MPTHLRPRARAREIASKAELTFAGQLDSRSALNAIDLRRQDEVVLVQTLDLVRLQRDGGIAPPEVDIGMVALRFGKCADLIDEAQRLPKIRKPKRPFDTAAVVEQ